MKNRLLILFALLVLSCGSSSKIQNSYLYEGRVNMSTENLSIKSSTPWFSAVSSNDVIVNNTVENRGNFLLGEVLFGYEDQVFGFEKSSKDAADIQFVVTEIRVKRGHFTLNFPNPGPLYRIMMDVSVIKDNLLVDELTISTRVNMSEVNFGHLPFKWLSLEEMNDSVYQLATFDAGLTKLFQKLYFDYFDISLYL